MRSSDLWLGLPYDIFNFTLIAARVAYLYNFTRWQSSEGGIGGHPGVGLGTLTVVAASSHLYERDWDRARAIVADWTPNVPSARFPVEKLWEPEGWNYVWESLRVCRDRSTVGSLWGIRPC